jgi:peptide/nickel transport system substrate-binding protein
MEQSPTRRARPAVLRALALLTLLGLVAGACGSGDDSPGPNAQSDENAGRVTIPEGDPVYGGTLVVGVSAESDGWTPQTNTFADAGVFVAASVIESLAVFNPEGEAVPYLAESWEPDATFENWTVTLREGIRFHDGSALDADAAKENIDQAVASPLVGIAMAPMIDNVEVVDDLTFIIHLERPWSALPGSMLALQPGMMVSPNMFDEEAFGARHPVGTGPFVFEEWIQDDRFVTVRNDRYWRKAENGDQLPYLDRLEFRVYVDSQSRALALDSGEIDMMYTLRAPDIANYQTMGDDDITLIQDNHREETFVQLNEARPPFDNVHARRAVAMSVDPAAIAAVLGEGITQPVDQPFTPDEPYFNEEAGFVAYDPEEAQRELELYFEDTGEDQLSFTMGGLPSVDDAELLQLLVQQWNEAGIDATLANVEQTKFIVDLATGNFEAAYFRNFAGTEPDSYYVFLHSSQAGTDGGEIRINFTSTRVPELDDLLDEQRATGDLEERVRIWQEIVPIINEELPYVWLFNTPYALVATPDIKGLNVVRELGFGNFELKWWLGEVWREQ